MITFEEKLRRLNEIGIALSIEHNLNTLLKKILLYAKSLMHADGGTLYTVTPKQTLHFEIVASDTLEGKEFVIQFDEVPLFLSENIPNDNNIVAYAVNKRQTINVHDAYMEEGFDFSGTKKFDAKAGYRTKSVLTIPIINHENKVIAALQLINALHPESQEIISFTLQDQELGESLASQAGIAITNQLLLLQLKNLFKSFVKIISDAIDEKSPSTGNHGRRVPILALLLAEAVNATREGPYKDVSFNRDELEEIELAAFLHDCGKIVTPSHIVEKHKKLETIFDRIELVNSRLENLKQEAKIKSLEKKLSWFENNSTFDAKQSQDFFQNVENEYRKKIEQVDGDQAFVKKCNNGEQVIDNAALAQLNKLLSEGLINQDEYKNLSIPKGNLTDEERKIIERHVEITYNMLSQLPFPKELSHVPDIAAAHHERVDGKGYPWGLTKEQLLIQARILAIADVFEALSAPDRAYKKALPLSEVYAIMKKKCEDGELDSDLFSIFLHQNVGLNYAKAYLAPEQIDVDQLQSVR